MSNIIPGESSGFVLFYTLGSPNGSVIKRAPSDDGLTWHATGVALNGSADPNDTQFDLGGQSVLKLNDGRYRMYYRSCPKRASDKEIPKYQVFSAISSDGVTFAKEEGTRISNRTYDPSSPLKLAGHGSYIAVDGGFTGIFSGSKVESTGPSDLMFVSSTDGITWSNPKTRYRGWHDPSIKRVGKHFIMYASYLESGFAQYWGRFPIVHLP